jgi:predicted small metal-binding protein
MARNSETSSKHPRASVGGGGIQSTPAARDSRELTFRCADVGRENCNWEVRGHSEQELMPQIEQHAREHHNISLDEGARRRVLDAIHHRSAA